MLCPYKKREKSEKLIFLKILFNHLGIGNDKQFGIFKKYEKNYSLFLHFLLMFGLMHTVTMIDSPSNPSVGYKLPKKCNFFDKSLVITHDQHFSLLKHFFSFICDVNYFVFISYYLYCI